MDRPAQGLCPVCESVFDYAPRTQGGGRRRIYCSARCRSLDWIHGNGGKRTASVIKYDNQPENKLHKRERTRKATLARYYLSEEEFEQILLRQSGKCLGCLCPIDRYSARIDHCHQTNHVRGLLCDHCNWAIGHAKDNPTTLMRLAAYLG